MSVIEKEKVKELTEQEIFELQAAANMAGKAATSITSSLEDMVIGLGGEKPAPMVIFIDITEDYEDGTVDIQVDALSGTNFYSECVPMDERDGKEEQLKRIFSNTPYDVYVLTQKSEELASKAFSQSTVQNLSLNSVNTVSDSARENIGIIRELYNELIK